MTNDKTQSFSTQAGIDRRREERHNIHVNVNYSCGDTYLYSKSDNISEMGIFLVSDTPLAAGTMINLSFNNPQGGSPVDVTGEVVWIDPGNSDSPGGMGVRFNNPTEETKAKIRTFIRTMAYID
ncbi:MAG: PilZ domain-containing protein [Deltaproteobacteria bacterium]|nr:PilZ domain-containing protein [Deltaproteobacteria bacterium]